MKDNLKDSQYIKALLNDHRKLSNVHDPHIQWHIERLTRIANKLVYIERNPELDERINAMTRSN